MRAVLLLQRARVTVLPYHLRQMQPKSKHPLPSAVPFATASGSWIWHLIVQTPFMSDWFAYCRCRFILWWNLSCKTMVSIRFCGILTVHHFTVEPTFLDWIPCHRVSLEIEPSSDWLSYSERHFELDLRELVYLIKGKGTYLLVIMCGIKPTVGLLMLGGKSPVENNNRDFSAFFAEILMFQSGSWQGPQGLRIEIKTYLIKQIDWVVAGGV